MIEREKNRGCILLPEGQSVSRSDEDTETGGNEMTPGRPLWRGYPKALAVHRPAGVGLICTMHLASSPIDKSLCEPGTDGHPAAQTKRVKEEEEEASRSWNAARRTGSC